MGHSFALAAFLLHCGCRHCFGYHVELCRYAGDMLFGTFAGVALQLSGG